MDFSDDQKPIFQQNDITCALTVKITLLLVIGTCYNSFECMSRIYHKQTHFDDSNVVVKRSNVSQLC